MIFMLRVDVEDVVEPPGGGLLGRGVALIDVQLVDEIGAVMLCLVGIVVQVE